MFFFFNDTATTEIYTLSLHDALPICALLEEMRDRAERFGGLRGFARDDPQIKLRQLRGVSCGAKLRDRKSTRLNSSHGYISYAVFCLKKKKDNTVTSVLSNHQHDENS